MKMKAAKAWAIVHADGNLAMPWGIHGTFTSRKYAAKALKNYGVLASVRRVQITELTPKPRKKR